MERAWAEKIVKLVETLTYNYTLDIKTSIPRLFSFTIGGLTFGFHLDGMLLMQGCVGISAT